MQPAKVSTALGPILPHAVLPALMRWALGGAASAQPCVATSLAARHESDLLLLLACRVRRKRQGRQPDHQLWKDPGKGPVS